MELGAAIKGKEQHGNQHIISPDHTLQAEVSNRDVMFNNSVIFNSNVWLFAHL